MNNCLSVIGHFRVPFASVSKRVQVRNRRYENQFSSQAHSNANFTHFHMKDFALGLVLKQRQEATRKWPIFRVEYEEACVLHLLEMPAKEARLFNNYSPKAEYLPRRSQGY